MTRDEFLALPPGVALGVLFDASENFRRLIESTPAPTIPRPPKYDYRIRRKDGFQWASETHLDSLRWFHDRAAEGVANGGQYAELDEKRVKQLDRWIVWRIAFPEKAWRGERDDETVTAAPPSHKPTIHPRDVGSAPSHEEYAMP